MRDNKSVMISRIEAQIAIMTEHINRIAELREWCAVGEKPVTNALMEEYIMWNDVLGKCGNAKYSMQMAKERLEESDT